MIYNKTTVAKIIHANIKNLNKQIENYGSKSADPEVEKKFSFDYLVQWKNKNINTLHEMGHISDDEMQMHTDFGNYLFTPKIEIK